MPQRGGAAGAQRPGPARSPADPRRACCAVYSLSKQSNLAGYRAAFVAGDPALMANLVNSRKHAGMIVPYPVQEAMRVALGDDAHVQAQKDLYRGRRERLCRRWRRFGLEIHDSEAGLYLWAPPGKPPGTPWAASRTAGSSSVPGVFYGDAGNGFVRVALTGTDERIDAAVGTGLPPAGVTML